MRKCSEYRAIARQALRGNWAVASAVTAVATLLGAVTYSGQLWITFSTKQIAEANIPSPWDYFTSVFTNTEFARFFTVFASFCVFLGTIGFIIGGAVELGEKKYNSKLVDGGSASFGDLFSRFDRFVDGFLMNLLRFIYIVLWTFLFIIPGIVKTYAYRMTPFLLNDYPDISANKAIGLSDKIMRGHKGKLFVLDLTFLGWALLAFLPASFGLFLLARAGSPSAPLFFTVLTLMFISWLGGRVVAAYAECAQAAFYSDLLSAYVMEQQAMEQQDHSFPRPDLEQGDVNHGGYIDANKPNNNPFELK